METKEQILWQIANTVMVNHQFVNPTGLYAGRCGLALFLFKAAHALQVDAYEDFASQIWQECISSLAWQQDIDFKHGMTGIGWATLFILKQGWAEGDPDEVLGNLDLKIERTLNRPFEFGDFVHGDFILPHFYLLERHKGDTLYWYTHESIICHLKEAVNKRRENGGEFSETCRESIDRFFLSTTGKPIFTTKYPGTLYCNTPANLSTQAWKTLLYGQNIIWQFTEKELADYIDRRIADFDATEDLNLQGILGIGLII